MCDNHFVTPEKALKMLFEACHLMPDIKINILDACGYFNAFDLLAKNDNPKTNCAAMDGFALKTEALQYLPKKFKIIENIPAGKIPKKIIQNNQAARIFTGSIIPKAADIVIPQENTSFDQKQVIVNKFDINNKYIRKKACDFEYQQKIVDKGKKITPQDIALITAANYSQINVRQKPNISIICCGDEIKPPGKAILKNQIVYSNYFLLHLLATKYGANVGKIQTAKDKLNSIENSIENSLKADIIVTIGGASVGKYDLVKTALQNFNYKKIFQNIAMRPGKPIFAGYVETHKTIILGLPGNPVSAYVGAEIFLKAIIAKMSGNNFKHKICNVRINENLEKNDHRQTYVRAEIKIDRNYDTYAQIIKNQDSASNYTISKTQAFIIRKPHAPRLEKFSKAKAIFL